MINNWRDEQNVIRWSGNISYLCVRSRIRPGDPPDNGEEEKHTLTKETKGTDASRPTDAEEARVYDLESHLGHYCTHTHMHAHGHSRENHTHMPWTTHCLADLFKSQELCLSFPTSCSQKYLRESSVVFYECVCVFFFFNAYVDMHNTDRVHKNLGQWRAQIFWGSGAQVEMGWGVTFCNKWEY